MTPMKLDVLIALYCFGGNGGVATILPDIALWLMKLQKSLDGDDRVGRVGIQKFGDIPLTMARNHCVKTAKDGKLDVILMIDSDNVPDLYLGKKPWAKPFWDTSFEFLYERKRRGLPSVIAAPYCGPPPHPANGGCENVYVFKAEDNETGRPEMGFRFEAYDRGTASQMRGIQEIAAGPTGCIIYTTDAFDLMPVGKMSRPEILDAYRAGDIDQDRALRLLSMESWFFYEFTDGYQTQKASTEDVTNTREIQLAGINKHGEPIVFCNWDAWAGHYKPKCVGMPEPIRMEQINSLYREACETQLSAFEEVRNVDFGVPAARNGNDSEPSPSGDDPPPENGQNELPGKHLIVPRMLFGRKVNSVGHVTAEVDLAALHWLVKQLAERNPEKHLRVIEIGSWVGESAIALQSGFGPAGGTVFCVDTWEGTPNDATGTIGKLVGQKKLFQHFLDNVGDLIDSTIKVIRGDSLTVAKAFSESGPQAADLIFIDANHDYEWIKADLHAWIEHLADDGIFCGHDFVDGFPGVVEAVMEFCAEFGVEPKTPEDTGLWFIEKSELLAGKKADDGASAAADESGTDA